MSENLSSPRVLVLAFSPFWFTYPSLLLRRAGGWSAIANVLSPGKFDAQDIRGHASWPLPLYVKRLSDGSTGLLSTSGT
ncbi:hypothetical protein FA13DRAFT_857958 [Coprinellus micaceus]|uniref:Uncharacterized protein n=1 Tax=Coprinellus micaceus TaxID=71717 RepID=A0A4Y7T0W9_COPMI|nr:hypothetical protein FA13DRAFT_857958 [Coprinellus micaceus]